MLFVIFCTDKEAHAHVRLENRSAHVDYLKAAGDVLKIGGPTTTEDGTGMTGSMLVIDAENQAEAETWAANDPYAQAELFESVVVRPWRWTFGNPDA